MQALSVLRAQLDLSRRSTSPTSDDSAVARENNAMDDSIDVGDVFFSPNKLSVTRTPRDGGGKGAGREEGGGERGERDRVSGVAPVLPPQKFGPSESRSPPQSFKRASAQQDTRSGDGEQLLQPRFSKLPWGGQIVPEKEIGREELRGASEEAAGAKGFAARKSPVGILKGWSRALNPCVGMLSHCDIAGLLSCLVRAREHNRR